MDETVSIDDEEGGWTPPLTGPDWRAIQIRHVAAGTWGSGREGGLECKRCVGVDFSASVPWKAVVSVVSCGRSRPFATLIGRAYTTLQYRTPEGSDATSGHGSGWNGFAVDFMNLDTSQSADAYATIWFDDGPNDPGAAP